MLGSSPSTVYGLHHFDLVDTGLVDQRWVPASERLRVDVVVQHTPFWRLKTAIATFLASAISAWDYMPGLVPETKVLITDRGTGAVVYEDTVRWSVNSAEGAGAAIKEDLDAMDLETFCDEYGIDLGRSVIGGP